MDQDKQHAEALSETGFWGRRGAGCLLLARSTGRLLIGLRSAGVQEPGTWGTWGGAVDEHEEPSDAVLREIAEEAGYQGNPLEMHPLYVFEDANSGFSYHNFLVVIEDEFDPKLGWETDDSAWFEPGNWPTPLHFGLEKLIADEASLLVIEKKSVERRLKAMP